jgi:hypothetical protein
VFFKCHLKVGADKSRLWTHYTGYVLRLYDTMLNFVVNLLENERGAMNGQDLTKTDYDTDRSLVLSRVSLIF